MIVAWVHQNSTSTEQLCGVDSSRSNFWYEFLISCGFLGCFYYDYMKQLEGKQQLHWSWPWQWIVSQPLITNQLTDLTADLAPVMILT